MIAAEVRPAGTNHATTPNPTEGITPVVLNQCSLAPLLLLLAFGSTIRGEQPAETPSSAAGPWIRANQVGYLPDDPKIALLSSDTRVIASSTVSPAL